MKNISNSVMTGLLVMGLSFSAMPFAHAWGEAAFTKLMGDSAAALQPSRPDLAAGLMSWSNEEASGDPRISEKEEMESMTKDELYADREGHLKLLRDSAAALQQSRPTLSVDLTEMANRKEKWITKKYKEEAREREKTNRG